MTKYTLHEGKSKDINTDNDSFFTKMIKGLEGQVNLQLNYFLRDYAEIADVNNFIKQLLKA